MERVLNRLFSRSLTLVRFSTSSSTTSRKFCSKVEDTSSEDSQKELINLQSTQILEGLGQNIVGNLRRPKARDRSKERDRRITILWDVSVRYMESEAYAKAYGDNHVWKLYRRNRPYQFDRPGRMNRVSCIGDDGFIQYGQACPICRDEYLILDYRNVKLLKQFINPATEEIYPWRKTNLCLKKHEKLMIEVLKARDYGTLIYRVPFKQFDYRHYYTAEQLAQLELVEDVDLLDDQKLHEELGKPDFGDQHDFSYVDFP